MSVQAAMKSLGEVDGVRWFWAEPGLFTVPGVYYWDGTANVHVTATRAAAVPQGVLDSDALDAARWRAVVGCARVRLLGSAGLHSENDVYWNPHGNYAHIGLELWTKHDACSHPEAVAYFTKFADKAVAATTPPPAELGRES